MGLGRCWPGPRLPGPVSEPQCAHLEVGVEVEPLTGCCEVGAHPWGAPERRPFAVCRRSLDVWIGFSAVEGAAAGPAPQGGAFSLESCQNWLPGEPHPATAERCVRLGPAGQCNTDLCSAPHSYVCELRPGGARDPGWVGGSACCPGQEPGSPPHLASTAAPSTGSVLITCLLSVPCLDWARSRYGEPGPAARQLSPGSLNPWAPNTLLLPGPTISLHACTPGPVWDAENFLVGAPNGDLQGTLSPLEQQEALLAPQEPVEVGGPFGLLASRKQEDWDWPGGPVAGTARSQCTGPGLIPGRGTRTHRPQRGLTPRAQKTHGAAK